MLAVAKASSGSFRHAERAHRAIDNAICTLDGHHGSSAGAVIPSFGSECKMGGKGKGKNGAKGAEGKSGETFDQKTKRLDKEIQAAVKTQNKEEMDYLWKTKDKHLSSTQWWPPADTSKGKGKGKGKFATETAKVQALRSEIKQLKEKKNADSSDSSSSAAGNRSSSSGDKDAANGGGSSRRRSRSRERRSASRTTSRASSSGRARSTSVKFLTDSQQKNQERKKAKEERKRLEKEQAGTTDGDQKPTRVCPECYFKGTYASSLKCFKCKVPFGGQPVPTPQPPPKLSEAWSSTTNKAAASALEDIHKQALVHLKGFAQAQPTPPPPPAPPPLNGAAATPAVPQVAGSSTTPGVSAQPATSAPTIALTDADAAADEEGAKQLIALKERRAATLEQLKLDTEDLDWQAALKARLDRVNRELEALLAKRQAGLEPHQLGQVLSKKQLQASEAAKAATDLEKAAQESLAALDKEAADLQAKYDGHIELLRTAKVKAQENSAAERTALQTTLKVKLDEALEHKALTQRLLDTAQAAHDAQTGAAATAAQASLLAQEEAQKRQLAAQQAAADAHLGQQKAAADAHLEQLKQAAELHQQQQDSLVAQQREAAALHTAQQGELQAKVAEQQRQVQHQQQLLAEAQRKLAEQQQTLQPTALLPPAVLPDPQMPGCESAAQALYVLQLALKRLAMQESQVLFTWADLASAQLCWTDFCKLVPALVTAESVQDLDLVQGPRLTDQIPRRTLECLRVQLDTIMGQWTAQNAEAAARTDLQNQASAFAATILDQAKRIQDKKRHAEPLEKSQPAKLAAPDAATTA